MSNILFFLPCFLVASAISAQPAAPQASSAPGANTEQHSCSVDLSMPAEGDTALAKKDYIAAEVLYRAAISAKPESEEAHLGLVRALIGRDDVSGARLEAAKFLALHPKDSLPHVAIAEVEYRDANLDTAQDELATAIQENRCDGRAFAAEAIQARLAANYALSARYLSAAHKLRPNDELIRRDWIESLPKRERAVELSRYLGETPALSPSDSIDFSNEATYLKAYRPGECRVTSKIDSTKIPLNPIFADSMFSISSFGLDVMLNGQRRRMQIDTGASGIILTSAAAKRLGLTAEYHLKAGGVGDRGDVDSYLTHVANIQIGDIQISDCMVEVLQKSDLGVQDGLIGLDVFDKWLVTLDYPLNELRLGPLPSIPGQKVSETLDDQNRLPTDRYIAPEMKDWLKIARVGHELLLPSRLNKGTVHLLLIDTGASQTTFSPSFAKEAGPLGTDYSTKFRGLSGDINHVYHTGDVVLQFGSLLLPASQFSVFDITSVSHNTGVEVSGFVGLPTLSRLTVAIDYRDNLLQLKYDPKHDSRHFRGK